MKSIVVFLKDLITLPHGIKTRLRAADTLLLLLLTCTAAKAQQINLVKDIWPGFSHGNPKYFHLVNNQVVFFANDGLNGLQLWRTDGTDAGTRTIASPAPFTSGYNNVNAQFFVSPNRLFFTAYANGINYMVSTDGTSTGTYAWDMEAVLGGSTIEEYRISGNYLFFNLYTDAHGFEMYKTDGTAAGTVRVKDIVPGSGNSLPLFFSETDNGIFYFQAGIDDFSNVELWKTDGTDAGTVLVKDINVGAESSSPDNFVKAGNVFYFAATNGNANGRELWKTNGTEAGTVMVKDINPGAASSSPANFYYANGVVYFTATDASGTNLWKTDGTEAGTIRLSSGVSGFSYIPRYGSSGANVYFVAATSASGQELWKTDGTPAGTSMVADIVPGNVGSNPANLTGINGALYFTASPVLGKYNLYKTDGTAGGTELVKTDVAEDMQSNGSQLFFKVDKGTTHNDPDNPSLTLRSYELWKTDGSAAGTVSLYDADPVKESLLTPLGIYVNIMDDLLGRELYFGSLKPLPAITFSLPAKTYGDADFELSAISANTASPITYSSSNTAIAEVYQDAADNNKWKVKIKGAGTVVITASQVASSQYDPVNVDRNLVVNKKGLTITARDAMKVVNEPLPAFSADYTGFVNNEDASVFTAPMVITTAAAANSPAGTYDIVPGGAAAANYAISFVNGILTIAQAGTTAQTITFAASQTKTYGDADFDAGATTNSALTVYYSSSDPAIATIVHGKVHIVKAGTVTITAYQYGSTVYAPAAPVAQTLIINKAPLTISASSITRPRGQNNPALTYTINGFVNGENETVLLTRVSLSTTATASSAAGLYPIIISGATAENYNITFVDGTLTVSATQIVSWNPFSVMVYGDPAFDPGAVSEINTTPVYNTNNPAVAVIENGKIRITGAGTAVITVTFPPSGGYEMTTVTQTLLVQKKGLIIVADNKTRKYGEANPAFTVTYNGFTNGDTYVNLHKQPEVATSATATSAVGAYPITVTGAESNNYEITHVNGQLTIEKTDVTITFNDMPIKTYGDAVFDAGGFASTGEALHYTSSNAAVAIIENGKIKITGAGTTEITASLPVRSNYTSVTPVSRTLTVNKAPLLVTAEDKVITAGGPAATLSVCYSGLAYGESELELTKMPVVSTTALATSPAGTYLITVNGAQSDNYQISYVNGTLTIIPAGIGESSLDAWSSSAGILEVRVYSATAKKAGIQLYSFSGQRLITVEKQLAAGINSYQLPVGNVAAGVYIVHVVTDSFRLKKHVKIK